MLVTNEPVQQQRQKKEYLEAFQGDRQDRAYRNELKRFAESLDWDIFGTLGIGHWQSDSETIRRLRIIEAKLTKAFVGKKYNEMQDFDRFIGLVVFEGNPLDGDRHCHFLMRVPEPVKRAISWDQVLENLPAWINALWDDLSEKPWEWSEFRRKMGAPGWYHGYSDSKLALDIGPCREGGPGYTIKQVRWGQDDWSFITPPKFSSFTNTNLYVKFNKDKQRRAIVKLDSVAKSDCSFH
jgi:hypothetical protein